MDATRISRSVFPFICIALTAVSNAAKVTQEKATSQSSFVWLTDIHMDLLYNPHASGKDWCRSEFNREEWEVEQRRHAPTMGSRLPYGPGWRGSIGGEGPQRPMTNEMSPPLKDVRANSEAREFLTLPAYWGRFGCDAPPQLVEHCSNSIVNETARHLQEAIDQNGRTVESFLRKPFIVVTGDLAAHYWEEGRKQYRWDSLTVLSSMLVELSLNLGASYDQIVAGTGAGYYQSHHVNGSAQLLIAVGNNDLPKDFIMDEWDEWAGDLYRIWSPEIIPPTDENEETFRRGMYYWAPVKSVPNLRALCLNTMWWSRARGWDTSPPKDPAGQFDWLSRQLIDAEKSGDQVLILGHIPPGYSYFSDRAFSPEPQWYNDYEDQFLNLIATHQKIIVAQLFGHFHSDDLRVQLLQSLNGGTTNGTEIGSDRMMMDEGSISTNNGSGMSNTEQVEIRQRLRMVKKKKIEKISWEDVLIDAGSTTVGAALLAPSIGTTHGNNPGWRLMDLMTTGVENDEEKSQETSGYYDATDAKGEAEKDDEGWSTVSQFIKRLWNGKKLSQDYETDHQLPTIEEEKKLKQSENRFRNDTVYLQISPDRFESILIDYTQFVAHLHSASPNNLGTYSPREPPKFVAEYRFRELYDQPTVTAGSIQSALGRIQTDMDLFDKYWKYFNTEGGQPAAFFLRCVQSISRWRTMRDCMTALVQQASMSVESNREKLVSFSELVIIS